MKEIMKYVNLGLDIGSTTVKAVLTDRQTGRILFRRYQRHHAEQRRTLCQLVGRDPGQVWPACPCGWRSAGRAAVPWPTR